MALSQQDLAEIKLTSQTIAREIIKEVMAQHIESCPYGQAYSRNKAFLVGMLVGFGLLTGGAGVMIGKFLLAIK